MENLSCLMWQTKVLWLRNESRAHYITGMRIKRVQLTNKDVWPITTWTLLILRALNVGFNIRQSGRSIIIGSSTGPCWTIIIQALFRVKYQKIGLFHQSVTINAVSFGNLHWLSKSLNGRILKEFHKGMKSFSSDQSFF